MIAQALLSDFAKQAEIDNTRLLTAEEIERLEHLYVEGDHEILLILDTLETVDLSWHQKKNIWFYVQKSEKFFSLEDYPLPTSTIVNLAETTFSSILVCKDVPYWNK